MVKELETLYKDCRSNSCIEHAMGIMEHEKAPNDLSKKIYDVSISANGNDNKVSNTFSLFFFFCMVSV